MIQNNHDSNNKGCVREGILKEKWNIKRKIVSVSVG